MKSPESKMMSKEKLPTKNAGAILAKAASKTPMAMKVSPKKMGGMGKKG
jgi:hypothetical protein